MAAIRGGANRSTELRLRYALVRYGVSGWTVRSTALPGHPDFIFVRERLVVFTDGCFWHGCPECGKGDVRTNRAYWRGKIDLNRRRDVVVNQKLRRAGWRVIRVWEHELWPSPFPAVNRIRGALSSQRPPRQRPPLFLEKPAKRREKP